MFRKPDLFIQEVIDRTATTNQHWGQSWSTADAISDLKYKTVTTLLTYLQKWFFACELLHSKLLKAKLSVPAGWVQLFWVLCLCPVCFHPGTYQNDWFKCICLMYTMKKTTVRCSRGCLAEVRFHVFLWKEIYSTVLVLNGASNFHHMHQLIWASQ